MKTIMEIFSKETPLDLLSSGEIRFPPLKLRLVERQPKGLGASVDATVEVQWDRKAQLFVLECRTRTTPRALEEAASRAKLAAVPPDSYPMVLVPHLSEENLRRLEDLQVSGLDLNGNGYVSVPGQLLILRSGSPNRFSQPQPLANPYRGSASLVARTLLIYSEFPTAKDILLAAQKRGAASLSLGTVSKALQGLADDLVVDRSGRKITVTDSELLLQKLVQNFRAPRVTGKLTGKCPLERIDYVLAQRANSNLKLIPTGRWSAQAYAAAARSGPFSLYCSNLNLFLEFASPGGFEEDEFFPDLEILETTDAAVYFDGRTSEHDQYTWSSPVQSYLELMSGGEKREREIAEQVRKAIAPRAWPGIE